MRNEFGVPAVVDRSTFQAELDALRVREKAHTREGDAIAAARRRLPMVEIDSAIPLIGDGGAVTLLDAFEGRRLLIAYYFMWHTGHPAAEQCEGCTFYISQVRGLSYLHSRDVTYATFCQGPYEEVLYRNFMGWEMPWYSAQDSLDTLLVGRRVGMMHIRLLPATRIQCLRDLLDDDARRRGDGQQLRFARHDGLRAAGDMGGLADRLATTVERQAALPLPMDVPPPSGLA
jgi:Bacterial protein of unknown function (DUF899)